jgi:hypothetical protein
MKRILPVFALFCIIAVALTAQGSGTPNNLRVRTDSNNALVISAASQTPPYTTSVFNNTRLKTDSDGNLVVAIDGGGLAPADATFILQTPDGVLSNAQALNALSSGIMRVATTTGVVTSLTNSAGIAANISDETGTGVLAFNTNPTFAGILTGVDFQSGVTNDNGYCFASTANCFTYLPIVFNRPAILARNTATTRAIGVVQAYPVILVTGAVEANEGRSNAFHITDDADGQSITLLNDPIEVGIMWHFMVNQTQSASAMIISPSAGETIRFNGSACSSFQSAVRDAFATIAVTTAGSGGVFTVLTTNDPTDWTCNP